MPWDADHQPRSAESLFETSKLDRLFPSGYGSNSLADLCQQGLDALAALMPDGDLPRVPGWEGASGYGPLLERYADLPAELHSDLAGLVAEMSRDFFAGAVNWRCPELQYNLGAAVNVVSAAMYALSLDVNVYLINDGLAGNAVVAEQAVSRILLSLADVPQGRGGGLFTFGGTGTIAYAIKVGLRRAAPDSVRVGRPNRLRVFITEDAHFSHPTAADWLGIGSDEIVVLPPALDRRTRADTAERALRDALRSGYLVPAILLNGGTTYDHTIDDVSSFVALRDSLVKEFGLPYVPHLHVDTVVGWAWLMFRDYDFEVNPLDIEARALDLIRRQCERVRAVRFADSWSVDFHKGVGGCPIDCSMFVANDAADIVRLSKGGIPQASTHQLADELSVLSPVDYTLETSRAGGKALAALASLHGLGIEGYRRALANLMENTLLFRGLVHASDDIAVLNDYAYGYQSMVRLYPPQQVRDPRRGRELVDADRAMVAFIEEGNVYQKSFFDWDNRTRMEPNGGGVVYSFTRHFVTTPGGAAISGLKFYPTSPRITRSHVRAAVALLQERKREYDARQLSGASRSGIQRQEA